MLRRAEAKGIIPPGTKTDWRYQCVHKPLFASRKGVGKAYRDLCRIHAICPESVAVVARDLFDFEGAHDYRDWHGGCLRWLRMVKANHCEVFEAAIVLATLEDGWSPTLIACALKGV